MNAKFGWLIVGCVVCVFSVATCWQLSASAAIRTDLSRGKITLGSVAATHAERERLLALQPKAEELDRLAADALALPRARDELAALLAQTQRALRDAAEQKTAPGERLAVGKTVGAAEWRNAGATTPQAALETVLWAGAGGDVETFAKSIKFISAKARQAAQTLLESLPEEMRTRYNSPEQLIAFLSVRDVPLGSVKVQQLAPLEGWPVPAAQMHVMLKAADGNARDTALLFMNPGDGWRLVVTDGVVAKYSATLKKTQAAAERK